MAALNSHCSEWEKGKIPYVGQQVKSRVEKFGRGKKKENMECGEKEEKS